MEQAHGRLAVIERKQHICDKCKMQVENGGFLILQIPNLYLQFGSTLFVLNVVLISFYLNGFKFPLHCTYYPCRSYLCDVGW